MRLKQNASALPLKATWVKPHVDNLTVRDLHFFMVRYHWSPIRHDWFSQLVWPPLQWPMVLISFPMSFWSVANSPRSILTSSHHDWSSSPHCQLHFWFSFISFCGQSAMIDSPNWLKTHHEFSRQVEDLSSHLYPLFTSWREKPKRKNHWLLKYS